MITSSIHWHRFQLIYWSLLLIICVTILLYTFCIYRQQPKGSYDKKFIRLSFGGLIVSNLHILCFMIQCILIYINEDEYDFEIWLFGDTLAETFYVLSCIFIYLVFLYKIEIAFQGTRYQIGNCIIYVSYCVMAIFFILKLVDTTIDALLSEDILDNHIDEFWRTFYFLSLEVMDLSLSGILISLFIRKLLDVTVDLTDKSLQNGSNEDKDHELSYSGTVQLNDTQKGLLNVITKHSVLSITSVISAQIYFIILTTIHGIDEFGQNFESTKKERTAFNIAFIFWGMDGLINCLCICMNLDFNHSIYYIFCSSCHEYCKICCRRQTKAKIYRNHRLELQRQLLL